MPTKQYGLLGYPLSHSFSKGYFDRKFTDEGILDCTYENFELPHIDDISTLLHSNELLGFNVTIPYKKLILPYLNIVDPIAEKVGAINCVKRIGNTWKGYNTDVWGFEQSLLPLINSRQKNALILGTGGASNAIVFVLRQLGIHCHLVSSHEQEDCISYYDVDETLMQSVHLIVNTTPLGTFPNIEACPDIPYQWLSKAHLCYDLIYNPKETVFLKKSKEMGAETKNGQSMLELQAEKSWKIWNTFDS